MTAPPSSINAAHRLSHQHVLEWMSRSSPSSEEGRRAVQALQQAFNSTASSTPPHRPASQKPPGNHSRASPTSKLTAMLTVRPSGPAAWPVSEKLPSRAIFGDIVIPRRQSSSWFEGRLDESSNLEGTRRTSAHSQGLPPQHHNAAHQLTRSSGPNSNSQQQQQQQQQPDFSPAPLRARRKAQVNYRTTSCPVHHTVRSQEFSPTRLRPASIDTLVAAFHNSSSHLLGGVGSVSASAATPRSALAAASLVAQPPVSRGLPISTPALRLSLDASCDGVSTPFGSNIVALASARGAVSLSASTEEPVGVSLAIKSTPNSPHLLPPPQLDPRTIVPSPLRSSGGVSYTTPRLPPVPRNSPTFMTVAAGAAMARPAAAPAALPPQSRSEQLAARMELLLWAGEGLSAWSDDDE